MAETLIHNARIRTMDPAVPHAEWALFRDGRIAALGKGSPPDCRHRIDAGGRLVLPGLRDAHIHLLSGGIDMATAAFLFDVGSEDELISALRAQATKRSDMPIVFG